MSDSDSRDVERRLDERSARLDDAVDATAGREHVESLLESIAGLTSHTQEFEREAAEHLNLIDQRVVGLAADLDAYQRTKTARLDALQARQAEHTQRADDLTQSLVSLQASLEELGRHVTAFEGDALAHLDSLRDTAVSSADLDLARDDLEHKIKHWRQARADRVRDLETSTLSFRVEIRERLEKVERSTAQLLQTLSELHARPYMSDLSLLMTTDALGRTAIGFDAGCDPSDVAEDALYRGFEDIFRGPEEFIRERQRVYLELIEKGPVLDVGCGRGEFLDLLKEASVRARGVDIDNVMVAHCRIKGHQVEHADAIAYLEKRRNGSLAAIFASQVIEHLSFEDLRRFLAAARRKLQNDGLLIAETVNPHSIQALKTFWVDPTHRVPIFPEVATALCKLEQYAAAVIVFPNGSGELEEDITTQGEYAVIATPGDADALFGRLRKFKSANQFS